MQPPLLIGWGTRLMRPSTNCCCVRGQSCSMVCQRRHCAGNRVMRETDMLYHMLQLRWIATKRCFSCSLTSFSVLTWALVNDPWVVRWVAFYLWSMGSLVAAWSPLGDCLQGSGAANLGSEGFPTAEIQHQCAGPQQFHWWTPCIQPVAIVPNILTDTRSKRGLVLTWCLFGFDHFVALVSTNKTRSDIIWLGGTHWSSPSGPAKNGSLPAEWRSLDYDNTSPVCPSFSFTVLP